MSVRKSKYLFLLTHKHEQELEHVKEVNVEAERAVGCGLVQPLLIAVCGVGHILGLQALCVI